MMKSLQSRRRAWIVGGVAGALIVGGVAGGTAFAGSEGDGPPITVGTVSADRDDVPRGESAVLLIGPADAADIALAEIGSAYVVSVELDNDDGLFVWDVDAVDSDQVEHELKIHAVEGTILSYEKEHDDADRRDYDRAAAAPVTIRQAVEAALTEVPGGQVIEVDLHGEVAAPWWEVEIYNPSDETWQYVKVDALNGSLISVNDDYSVGDDDDDDRNDD